MAAASERRHGPCGPAVGRSRRGARRDDAQRLGRHRVGAEARAGAHPAPGPGLRPRDRAHPARRATGAARAAGVDQSGNFTAVWDENSGGMSAYEIRAASLAGRRFVVRDQGGGGRRGQRAFDRRGWPGNGRDRVRAGRESPRGGPHRLRRPVRRVGSLGVTAAAASEPQSASTTRAARSSSGRVRSALTSRLSRSGSARAPTSPLRSSYRPTGRRTRPPRRRSRCRRTPGRSCCGSSRWRRARPRSRRSSATPTDPGRPRLRRSPRRTSRRASRRSRSTGTARPWASGSPISARDPRCRSQSGRVAASSARTATCPRATSTRSTWR